jgi:hypothetical protein
MTAQAYKTTTISSMASGTSLRGYVTTTYQTLVERLGEPRGGSADGKSTVEWIMVFEDGTVATIYDWKTNSTPKDTYDWHIGGKGIGVLENVKGVLKLPTFSSSDI